MEFTGSIKINKRLDDDTYNLLVGLSKTRRMKRANLAAEFGCDGEFYVGSDDSTVVDYSTKPSTQPSLWLQWRIQDDHQTIKWDEGEKFYCYEEWMVYIIEKILKPRGYICTGKILTLWDLTGPTKILLVTNNQVQCLPMKEFLHF